jgi:hypothetical protein
MKKYFLPFFAFLLLAPIALRAQTSDLVFATVHGETFSLYLNGMLQNQDPVDRMVITRLDKPEYKIKVIIYAAGHSVTLSRTIHLAPDRELTYMIRKNPSGKYFLDKIADESLLRDHYVESDEDDDGYTEFVPPPPPGEILPGYSGPVGCPMPMSKDAFERAIESVKEKTFEDSKLTMAKQITGMNCLLSEQVKDLMLLLTFESSRLELAKFAYGHTYDLGNYFIVNDAFNFESSMKELDDFIRNPH